MQKGSEHLDLPNLYNFASGRLRHDAKTQSHLDTCEQCRADLDWLEWFGHFVVTEKQYEPPAWVLTNANNVFRLRKPGIVKVAKEIIARLVYDSFSEPLPVGVRRHDVPSRQTLYATDSMHVDLKIELGDEQGQIIGQVVADKGELEICGLRIELTQRGRVINESNTNALGEFVFDDLPKGNYELQIVLDDRMVRTPTVPLSK